MSLGLLHVLGHGKVFAQSARGSFIFLFCKYNPVLHMISKKTFTNVMAMSVFMFTILGLMEF